jgi:hypothetical protein
MWVIPGCLNRVLELSTWKAVQNPPLNNTISYCSKSANRPQTERRSSIQQQKQRRWWIGLDWEGSPVGRPKVKQFVGRGILAPWRRSWLLGLAVAATHRIGRHRLNFDFRSNPLLFHSSLWRQSETPAQSRVWDP